MHIPKHKLHQTSNISVIGYLRNMKAMEKRSVTEYEIILKIHFIICDDEQ